MKHSITITACTWCLKSALGRIFIRAIPTRRKMLARLFGLSLVLWPTCTARTSPIAILNTKTLCLLTLTPRQTSKSSTSDCQKNTRITVSSMILLVLFTPWRPNYCAEDTPSLLTFGRLESSASCSSHLQCHFTEKTGMLTRTVKKMYLKGCKFKVASH